MAKINYDEVKKINKSVDKNKNKEFDLVVVVVYGCIDRFFTSKFNCSSSSISYKKSVIPI